MRPLILTYIPRWARLTHSCAIQCGICTRITYRTRCTPRRRRGTFGAYSGIHRRRKRAGVTRRANLTQLPGDVVVLTHSTRHGNRRCFRRAFSTRCTLLTRRLAAAPRTRHRRRHRHQCRPTPRRNRRRLRRSITRHGIHASCRYRRHARQRHRRRISTRLHREHARPRRLAQKRCATRRERTRPHQLRAVIRTIRIRR
jgi:hypothetical protein